MLDGHVQSPGIFLDAALVLQRQLTAFVLTPAKGTNPMPFPPTWDVFAFMHTHEPDVTNFPFH